MLSRATQKSGARTHTAHRIRIQEEMKKITKNSALGAALEIVLCIESVMSENRIIGF
jgi:hypothetical protein